MALQRIISTSWKQADRGKGTHRHLSGTFHLIRATSFLRDHLGNGDIIAGFAANDESET